MKKIFLTLALLAGAVGAKATDFPYLVFQTQDGKITALTSSGLSLTTSGGVLTATNAKGTTTFTLTELSKMYFSTDGLTAINALLANDQSEVEVFGLNGQRLGRFAHLDAALRSLQPGVYVAKSGKQSQKIVVQ